jgi:hypothetical protein
MLLHLGYHGSRSELLTSLAGGQKTAQTHAPQAKEEKENLILHFYFVILITSEKEK